MFFWVSWYRKSLRHQCSKLGQEKRWKINGWNHWRVENYCKRCVFFSYLVSDPVLQLPGGRFLAFLVLQCHLVFSDLVWKIRVSEPLCVGSSSQVQGVTDEVKLQLLKIRDGQVKLWSFSVVCPFEEVTTLLCEIKIFVQLLQHVEVPDNAITDLKNRKLIESRWKFPRILTLTNASILNGTDVEWQVSFIVDI